MSFSCAVKDELCKIEIKKKCCVSFELAGILFPDRIYENLINQENKEYFFTFDNYEFLDRFIKLLGIICKKNIGTAITRGGDKKKKHLYLLSRDEIKLVTENFFNAQLAREIFFNNNHKIINKSCCKNAFLRGLFLSSGSISAPEKGYHLEITAHNEKAADLINNLIKSYGLNSKLVSRKNNFVVYLKEGENIVDFLNIIGAHNALMELENIRIVKELRNKVNRIVNCETANLEKTINASLRQIENIKYIEKNLGFDKLPDNLRVIAELRLKFSDVNLKELGEMINPPLGKSGVNHRLRKLDRIADDLRKLKGEL